MNGKKCTIVINDKTITISKKAIAASYCGAYCALWINQLEEKMHEDFPFHYKYNYKRIKDNVDFLPKRMSIAKMIKNSPANIWLDMVLDTESDF